MSTVDKKDFPAFVIPNNGCGHPGMTLRDWFAGEIAKGMWSNPALNDSLSKGSMDSLARCAFMAADSMLDARENGTNKS